jgi:hypothetical protein
MATVTKAAESAVQGPARSFHSPRSAEGAEEMRSDQSFHSPRLTEGAEETRSDQSYHSPRSTAVNRGRGRNALRPKLPQPAVNRG